MSFLMPSQRGFEHARPELNDLPPLPNTVNRIQMSFNYSPHSLPLPSTSPTIQNGSQSSFPPSPELPKVGQIRCCLFREYLECHRSQELTVVVADWALLSADLTFIYLDPVLASHLEDQAEPLIGKSLLAFVHPDEQTSAKHDLGSVLESKTLHGSVTRVRYSRLSRVRRQLGHHGPSHRWQDAEKVALDSNYMAVDIVINWAAEGLVLCFLHAVVDLNPDDNNEINKTDWSNWCGTPSMSNEQVQLLFQRLLGYIPQTGSMTRVFQILANQSERQLLMSWPPDSSAPVKGPTGRDYAKLVEDVRIGTGVPNGNDAKTSCTRRYKAQQWIPGTGDIESIFIPHGTVIFACHKVSGTSRGPPSSGATLHQLGYRPSDYSSSQGPQFYEQGGSYSLPPMPPSSNAGYNYLPNPSQHQQIPQSYSPQHWSQAAESSLQQPPYEPWSSPNAGQSSLPMSVSNVRSGSFPPNQQQWPQGTPYSNDNNGVPPGQRPVSPSLEYSEGSTAESPSTSTADVVPPPRRRVSPGSTRDHYGPGGKILGNRPVGVLRCSSCKATQSPEWRKGPSGKKELCNACGLRYARSRAKKEGHATNPNRRRKDKGLAKQGPATPPSSTASISSVLRRGYEDSSFVSTASAGSGSGGEAYPGPGFEGGGTPTPSPPSGNMNFVHYNHQHPSHHNPQNQQREGRQQFPTSTSFYPAPLSLSNSPAFHGNQGNQPSVPRLEHMPQYSDRVSPMMSSASPISHSPLTNTVAPASFERERNRDHHLPTPVSDDTRPPSGR